MELGEVEMLDAMTRVLVVKSLFALLKISDKDGSMRRALDHIGKVCDEAHGLKIKQLDERLRRVPPSELEWEKFWNKRCKK